MCIYARVNETGGNRSGLTSYRSNRSDQLPVKPVRPDYGLGRYQTGHNSKFKFEFKKIKIPKPVIPTGKPVKPAGKPVKPVYRPQFKIQI